MRVVLPTLLALSLVAGGCTQHVKTSEPTLTSVSATETVEVEAQAVAEARAEATPDAPVDSLPLTLEGSPSIGVPHATVTIVVSTDFECPYCSKLAPTLEALLERYPDDVRIFLKHNPLPFHQRAMPAAKATMAAHLQGKFWPYHNLVFANNSALEDADLENYARDLGLDIPRWRLDKESDVVARKIAHDQAAMLGHGARGTPSYFINGRMYSGARPLDLFVEYVEEAMTEAEALMETGTTPADIHAVLAARHATHTYVDSVIEGGHPPDPPPPPPRPDRPPLPPAYVEVEVHPDDPFIGPANAPVVLVEFSDFQCPFCNRFRGTLKALREAYPNDLKIVFKHLPLDFHKNARGAAMASLAAHAQGKFWAYHDLLFENQRELKPKQLERYAKKARLKMKAFKRFMRKNTGAAQIDRDMAQAVNLEARGTPTSFVNGYRLVGAQPAEAFIKIIESELAILR